MNQVEISAVSLQHCACVRTVKYKFLRAEIKPLKAQWLLYIPPSLTYNKIGNVRIRKY